MTVRPFKASLAAVCVATLAFSACGSNSLSSGGGGAQSNAPQPSVKQDAKLADKLPAKIKESKKIVVGTDATYAPNEFLDADGKTVIGSEVDLFNAVAAKFGVTAEFQPSAFDAIIGGVQGKKYDVGVSSFTINKQRLEQVNMVAYAKAGTQWAAAKGNPKKVDPENPCGRTIAVQTGTVQDEEDLPKKQEKCGANKINVLRYGAQNEATAAVVSGKADAMLADSPVVAYGVKQSGDKLEPVGQVYDAAPYGFVVAKDQKDFADAIAEALKEIKSDGAYQASFKKWGTENGMIDDFEVNPKVDS